MSYNHWFGIYLDFDLEDLKRQVKRAAELGCEYFCLDASWYRTSRSFLAGVGNWNTPDPHKFPKGSEDIRELSAFVRNLGMGFGFWHLIQLAMVDTDMLREHPELYRAATPGSRQPQAYRLRLETPEGEEFAYQTLRRMIDAWNVTWMRYESVPENGLRYNQGYYRVIDRLRNDVPELYIEICNGGGMRLDLGSVARAHGNWLSDHTSDPEVCRFMQTGALRFWPPDYLNLAVTAFRGRGGETATEHQVLSRMVGVLSFSGAIAEWNDNQTRRIRALVDAYTRRSAMTSASRCSSHCPSPAGSRIGTRWCSAMAVDRGNSCSCSGRPVQRAFGFDFQRRTGAGGYGQPPELPPLRRMGTH